jgi:hypothetical protein
MRDQTWSLPCDVPRFDTHASADPFGSMITAPALGAPVVSKVRGAKRIPSAINFLRALGSSRRSVHDHSTLQIDEDYSARATSYTGGSFVQWYLALAGFVANGNSAEVKVVAQEEWFSSSRSAWSRPM